MKVRIMFDWAGEMFSWYMDWELPFFPNVGDSFEFCSFVEENKLKEFKNVFFKGKFKYDGLEKDILGMLENCYNTKIVGINWRATSVELEITSNLFESKDWDVIY